MNTRKPPASTRKRAKNSETKGASPTQAEQRRSSRSSVRSLKRAHRFKTDAESHVYGLHAVEAALTNPARTPLRLLATRNAANELTSRLGRLPLEPEIVSAREIGRDMPAGAVHQGVLLETTPLADLTVQDACDASQLLLILDQVTDPHNVGAILRSAAIFGADALIITKRNSPPLGGVLAKTASGGLEHVKIAKVSNLARAIEEVKKMGFEVIGLDATAEKSLSEIHSSGPTALVLGSEGAGLRRLTREKCDWLAKLLDKGQDVTARGTISSLNVSNAAAIALYQLGRAR